MTNVISIDGVAMPAPTKYDPSFEDIDAANSGRNDSGIMTREVVRRKVAKLSLDWTMLTDSEMILVAGALQDTMQVTYWWGSYKTSTMYASSIQSSMVANPNNNETYWNVSVNFIEY